MVAPGASTPDVATSESPGGTVVSGTSDGAVEQPSISVPAMKAANPTPTPVETLRLHGG